MATVVQTRIVYCDAVINGEAGQLALELLDTGRVRATGPGGTLLEFDAAELADAWQKLLPQTDDTNGGEI